MKIFVLAFVIFTLNVYVGGETSLDPIDHVEIDEAKSKNNDVRNKRSGEFFSLLLKKKLGLIKSLAGVSSGKSFGHPANPFEQHLHPFQQSQPLPPLSYHTKSFNLWGIKKAILSSVLQATKAITGGVIAVKGQLLKAKGHAVVAKGKLLQTKGEAITNYGKNVATHAFDVHPQPQIDVQSAIGLFNHLPVTPVHQPTSYGVATALGYQGQPYPINAYPNNGYQVGGAGYPTGYGTGVSQTGYEAGSEYAGGNGYNGGNGYTAKRAVQNLAQESSVNQVQSAPPNQDSIKAGLLIFKPIKSSPQTMPGGDSGEPSQSLRQLYDRRPSQFPQTGGSLQNVFAGLQQANGFQTGLSASGYQGSLTDGFSSFPDYKFPTTSDRGSGAELDGLDSGPHNIDLQQQPTAGLEFGRQLAAAAAKFAGQQQQMSSLSYPHHEANGYGGYDQSHYPSDHSEEHLARDTHAHAGRTDRPKPSMTETGDAAAGFYLPAAMSYEGRDASAGYAKKRSAPKRDGDPTAAALSLGASIVPLKYNDESTNAEDQAKLKQTVQRFFSMLKQQRYDRHHYDGGSRRNGDGVSQFSVGKTDGRKSRLNSGTTRPALLVADRSKTTDKKGER